MNSYVTSYMVKLGLGTVQNRSEPFLAPPHMNQNQSLALNGRVSSMPLDFRKSQPKSSASREELEFYFLVSLSIFNECQSTFTLTVSHSVFVYVNLYVLVSPTEARMQPRNSPSSCTVCELLDTLAPQNHTASQSLSS